MELLPGSPVTHCGDTVRRPAQPWTPSVTALLQHLQVVGLRGAPRALGVDGEHREVVAGPRPDLDAETASSARVQAPT